MAGARGSARLRHLPARLVRATIDDLVTTLFPAECRTCAAPLIRAATLPICDSCRASPQPQTAPLCQICGGALDMDSPRFAVQPSPGHSPADGLLCYVCRQVPPPFARAVAYAVYQDELREMIHLLKYERMRGIAALLGAMLAEAMLQLEGIAAQNLIVVPVPLYPAKEHQRGYNQSQLLAQAAIAKLRRARPAWKLTCRPDLLARTRDTESQFLLNPRARRRNLEGAFAAESARMVPGCEILLIDDIYTTGATARQCAQVLRRAGARTVWVATLARAQTVQVALWDAESGVPARGFG